MTELIQQIVSGLAIGLVYAGLALALSVVFQGTGVLNFAQGEMAALSAFCAWALVSGGLSIWLAMPLVITGSFLAGVVVERVFIRPVEQAPELDILIVTLALYLAVNATTGAIWGYLPKRLDGPFGDGVLHLGGVVLTAQQLGMAGVLAVVLVAVGALFRFTSVGLRMRAAAQQPASSRLLGIRVGWMLALGWGVAAAVGAVAGMMAAPVIGVSPDMMSAPLLLAFSAAALGGFESRAGAVIGGLMIGVLSSLAAGYVPGLGGDLNAVVPFGVIVAVLLVRPSGLFGRPSTLRV
jgi:branched-chain amino acid transport system permease protein